MDKKFISGVIVMLILVFPGCQYDQTDYTPVIPENSYIPLPENLIAYNDDKSVSARYVDPTTRYNHGVLGDTIEAGGLLVVSKEKELYLKLDDRFVFEDLQPRLFDVDNDGKPEVITIMTSLDFGASVSVYKIAGDVLVPFVHSNFIGIPKRWLNIAAIHDLDGDGKLEIAWVETPHIGGTLKMARVESGSLQLLAEKSGVSNHQYGLRNMCLSALTLSNGFKDLWLPNDSYDAIIGFRLLNNQIIQEETIAQTTDPAIPLFMQHVFVGFQEDKSCVFVP
ncbi:MAG: VCBS repeat-containing protein [Bacteroidales bacterium]|nr:VCBS repeat-containing protein [Bacteroidales bacterium]